MKKVNILYIEQSTFGKDSLSNNEQFMVSIFEPLYKAEITTYTKTPDRNEIGQLISSKSIDVIFCDLSIRDDLGNNKLGLETIRYLKTMYPEIIICGISRDDIKYRETSIRQNIPTFDLFIDKTKILDNNFYLPHIRDEMQRLFCSNTEIEISTENLPHGKSKDFADDPFFKRVLKKITFTNHNADDRVCIKKIELYPTTGGYSSSHVYKMLCYTGNNAQVIRSIVKCSEKKKTLQEINNYLTYVKWYLPYTGRPEILSYAFGNPQMHQKSEKHHQTEQLQTTYGVICYSFAYNDDQPFSSLADKISKNEYVTVKDVIQKIFGKSHNQWYGPSNQEDSYTTINAYYYDMYFMNNTEPHDDVEQLVYAMGGHKYKDKYILNNIHFPSTHTLFSNIVASKYMQCICHGDLHANNILISDKGNEITFIDFQKTGKGHVFHDFVVFELSLRLYQAPPQEAVDFCALLNNEIAISKNDFSCANENNIWSCVKEVRLLAQQTFGDSENFNTYLLSMAMRAFKLFRDIGAKVDSWKSQSILAVLLANLLALDDKNKVT